MLDKLAYQDKNAFFQNVHPMAVLIFLTVLLVEALLFDNPLYLAGIFIVIMLCVLVSDVYAQCEFYLTGGLWMSMLLIVINALVCHAGETVLWYGPSIPIWGKLDISLEAICFGAVMGVRLLIIFMVFGLYNAVVHPDKIISLFSRFAFKSALILSLATRMFPAAVHDLAGVMEVQQMRGVDFTAGGLRQRLRKYSRLLGVILISSLEGSLQMAEAMQARAFGLGPRSYYHRFSLRPRDYICFVVSLTVIIFSLISKIRGWCNYTFYPRMGVLTGDAAALFCLGMIMFCLLLMVGIAWGWKYCPYLRSKI